MNSSNERQRRMSLIWLEKEAVLTSSAQTFKISPRMWQSLSKNLRCTRRTAWASMRLSCVTIALAGGSGLGLIWLILETSCLGIAKVQILLLQHYVGGSLLPRSIKEMATWSLWKEEVCTKLALPSSSIQPCHIPGTTRQKQHALHNSALVKHNNPITSCLKSHKVFRQLLNQKINLRELLLTKTTEVTTRSL